MSDSTLSWVSVTPLPVAPAIRFTPLNVALLAKELIWVIEPLMLCCIEAALRPCDCACVSVCLSVFNVLEMLLAALLAVETTWPPKERLSCTAVRPAMVPFIDWAIAYTAGLSAAELTFWPVEISFCVMVSELCVCCSDCSAASAPRLVLTENIGGLLLRGSGGARFCRAAARDNPTDCLTLRYRCPAILRRRQRGAGWRVIASERRAADRRGDHAPGLCLIA